MGSDSLAGTPVNAVIAWLESRAEEMAALVEALVAIDSENPPGRGLGAAGGCCGTRSTAWVSRPS